MFNYFFSIFHPVSITLAKSPDIRVITAMEAKLIKRGMTLE